jgi:hypothetical protein
MARMIAPISRADPRRGCCHYDDLDRFRREIWGEHVHHGLRHSGRESPEIFSCTGFAAPGFDIALIHDLGLAPAAHLRAWLVAWLARQSLAIKDVASWAIHAGGPRVLDAVEETLGLDRSATAPSRDVLASCGNVSSPTVLLILDRLRRLRNALPCVALAFGPGLPIEAALFTAQSPNRAACPPCSLREPSTSRSPARGWPAERWPCAWPVGEHASHCSTRRRSHATSSAASISAPKAGASWAAWTWRTRWPARAFLRSAGSGPPPRGSASSRPRWPVATVFRESALARLAASALPVGDWKTIAGVRVEVSIPRLCGIFYAGD